MADWHYHANHIDAPARGSKTVAMKDARVLRLHAALYATEFAHDTGWLVDPGINDGRQGLEFPFVVKCFRSDCTIVPAAVREP